MNELEALSDDPINREDNEALENDAELVSDSAQQLPLQLSFSYAKRHQVLLDDTAENCVAPRYGNRFRDVLLATSMIKESKSKRWEIGYFSSSHT